MAKFKPYSRRQFEGDYASFRRRNRAMLGWFTLAMIVLVGLATWWQIAAAGDRRFIWYLLGLTHAGTAALLLLAPRWLHLTTSPSAINDLRGAWGEDFTREVLTKARRRELIWGSVDGISIQGGDIDHLVVTRKGGLIAIDSKWRSQITPERLHDATTSAARAGRRASLVLRAEGLMKVDRSARHSAQDTLTVTPLVVIWGRGQNEVPVNTTLNDVEVIPGSNLLAWLNALDGEQVDEGPAADLIELLNQFREKVQLPTTTR